MDPDMIQVIKTLQNVSSTPLNDPHDIINYCKNVDSKCEFVSSTILDELEKHFGDYVLDKIKRYSEESPNLGNELEELDQISNSLEFSDLSTELSSTILHHLTSSNSNDESFISTLADFDDSSSSFSDSQYFLCDKKQYGRLSESLLPKNSSEVRVASLRKLYDVASTNLISHDIWSSSLKRNLKFCLSNDDHDDIFLLALSVHAKMLSSELPLVVQEAFTNLVSFLKVKLSFQFVANLPKSISLFNEKVRRYMAVFRLLNDGLKHVTKFWIRYRDSSSIIILNSFLDLLNTNFPLGGLNDRIIPSPLHLLSLIDVHAEWFTAWLSSFHGQKLFTKILADNEKFFQNLFLFISKSTTSLLKQHQLSLSQTKSVCDFHDNEYDVKHVKHSCFVHLLHIFFETLRYKNTSENFFGLIDDVKFLSGLQSLCAVMCRLRCVCLKENSDLCPAGIVASFLSSALTKNVKWSNEHGGAILEYILAIIESAPSHDGDVDSYLGLFHCFEVINRILQCRKTYIALSSVIVNGKTGLDIIITALDNIFKAITIGPSDLNKPQTMFLKLIFKVSAEFFSHYEGTLYIESHEFQTSFVEVYRKFFPSWKNTPHYIDMCNVIYKLLMSDVGINALHKISFLDDAIEVILSQNDRFQELQIDFSKLVSNFYAFRLLVSNSFIRSLSSQIWLDDIQVSNDLNGNIRILQDILPMIYLSEACVEISPLIDHLDNFHGSGDCSSLSILNLMISSLPMLFHLQHNFNFIERLLQKASDVIDEISWLGNYVLCRALILGGPGEKKLPPMNPNEKDLIEWEMLGSMSETSKYWIYEQKLDSCQIELSDVKADARCLKKLHCHMEMISALLLEVVDSSRETPPPNDPIYTNFNNLKDKEFGINMATRYGYNLGLVMDDARTTNQNFRDVINAVERMKNPEETGDFDFCVATLMLLMKSDSISVIRFFNELSHNECCKYLWLPWRSHCSESSKIAGIMCHQIELMLNAELPEVFSAFQISRYSPTHIVQLWLRQFFWQYLDMDQIARFLFLVLVHGGDYLLYFVVSVFRHLKQQIIYQCQRNNLASFLKMSEIQEYDISKQTEFMNKLHQSYHFSITNAMDFSQT